MIKIGAITVGQSPRQDVMVDLNPIFEGRAIVIQRGALDGMTKEAIAELAPCEGDYVLVSKLVDGSWVRFAERHIIKFLQEAINALVSDGVKIIMMLCTGEFNDALSSPVPLLYPEKILSAIVPVICDCEKIAIVAPDVEQTIQLMNRWENIVKRPEIYIANPYEGTDPINRILPDLQKSDAELVVLDCIGYTSEMKKLIQKEAGKLVVLPRTLLAEIACEITL